MTIVLNYRMTENRTFEGMWKEPAERMLEVLPRNLDDFSSLPHRKHCDFFYKNQRINAAQ